MKRLLASLGIMLSILFAALHVTPAMAAVTCQPVQASPTQWPFGAYTEYCGTSTQTNGSSMANSLNQPQFSNLPNYKQTGAAVAYLFHSPAEYKTFFGTGAGSPGSTDFGITDYNSNNQPIRSSIFEVNTAGTTNPNIPNTTAHEGGHWDDWILANITPGAVTQSSTADFIAEVTQDWTTFNTLAACYNSTNESYGIFSQHQGADGVYICNGTAGQGHALNTEYAGLTNKAVLQKAWPTIFGGTTDAQLFAESVAYESGNNQLASYPKDYDVFFENAFACTGTYNRYVTEFDAPPTSSYLAAGCPVPAVRTFCTRYFDGTTKYPGDGQIYNCIPGDSTASQITSSLDSIGAATGLVQTTLKNPSNHVLSVWVFNNYSDYQSLFTKLGRTKTTFSQTYAGYSYGDTSNFYILLFKNTNTVAVSQGQMIENGDHESGHAIDFFYGYNSQSENSEYDGLIQHDFLNLDYSVVKPTQAASTPRPACGTGGALEGYIDPSTVVQFCTNGVLESKYAGYTSNTQIIQKANNYLFTTTGSGITPSGWYELYAQEFAISALLNTGGGGWYTNSNALINGWFACSLAWPTNVYKDVAVPPTGLPAYCTTPDPIPNWYPLRS